jgi:hypothetical protein
MVSATWTVTSGPGVVTFGNDKAADTAASFSIDGTYVLRLTADDGGLSAFDELTITVNPENLPPIVNAGDNQTITLPASANLGGTVTDDGLPDPPAMVSATWTVTSGPGVVTFGNDKAADTTASFSIDGTYVLRLTADDGSLSAFDELTVTVNPDPNLAPVVNAGPDQTINLPNDATLDATVTDDGLPDPPGSVTTTWSMASGPGTVTFGNENLVDTTASFSVAGVYVLQLTADDSLLTGSDTVTITVNPDPNQPNVLDIRVAAGSDDAEEKASGRVNLTSKDLNLVVDKGDQTVGMRFNGVAIPSGATIVNAYIQFQVDEATSEATSLTLWAEATDDAPTFSRSSGDISLRTRTDNRVLWSPPPPPWLTVGEAGDDQKTPNIASLIQEVVGQSGWSSGNSLVIIITGTGERVAESYNGDQNGAPLLHVEYIF